MADKSPKLEAITDDEYVTITKAGQYIYRGDFITKDKFHSLLQMNPYLEVVSE